MLQHQSENKIALTTDGLWGTAWVGIQLNLQSWVLVINKVQAEIGFNPASQCNADSWAELYGWIMLNTLLTMLVVLVRPHPCQWCPSCRWHSISSWSFEVAGGKKVHVNLVPHWRNCQWGIGAGRGAFKIWSQIIIVPMARSCRGFCNHSFVPGSMRSLCDLDWHGEVPRWNPHLAWLPSHLSRRTHQ